MNVWIITTGSSDVQLKIDKEWPQLRDRAQQQKDDDKKLKIAKKIELTKSVVQSKGGDRPIIRFLAPARVMGIVYGNAIAADSEDYKYLDFPLLNNFSKLLQEQKIVFSRIIILVTNQAELFSDNEKKQPYCPYWQDTCTLKDILKQYFQNFIQKEGEVKPEFVELKPKAKRSDNASGMTLGLDDWDCVLQLVQEKFALLTDIPEDATVYVSHQAGTPAISSAVQFASLARFNTKVQFLVSNEYNSELTRTIESPKYLRGIQMQEAKRLLKRYDYAGVQQLLRPYLSLNNQELEQRIQSLLAIAVQWNFAEFDDFQQRLQAYNWDKTDIVTERFNHWWWVGYEAAYLAVIRLKQKNTVEALFHSFRAAEGIIAEWAKATYKNYIDDNGQSLFLEPDILKVLPNYLSDKQQQPVLKPHVLRELKEKLIDNSLSLYSASLYELLRVSKPKWQQNEHIKIVWNVAAKRRNQRFHQILGMKELEVFDAWETNNSQQWEQRVLACLNFVTDQNFSSLQEVSLMALVHQELVDAIDQYQP